MFKRHGRTRRAVTDSGVTGEITDHTRIMTEKAIVQMLAGDPYFDFGVKAVRIAAKHELTKEVASQWMAEALGISLHRFEKHGPSFIDPNLTIRQLKAMMDAIDRAVMQRRKIILATGHPGSMLEFYLALEGYIRAHQSENLLLSIDKSWKLTQSTIIDCVGSVLMVSDVGSLIHTHEFAPMQSVLQQHKRQVDLVVADHGFAGAAINAGIKTIGLHDVDDPAIPIAQRLGLDVLPVPMNDNRGNLSTHDALRAVITGR